MNTEEITGVKPIHTYYTIFRPECKALFFKISLT